jgi:phage major head subunit gpT-like protein
VVLEVTAKDETGKTMFHETKDYFEIGVDSARNMRYGAWQIKEMIDLTIPPIEIQKERYLMKFEKDTKAVDLEVKLWYYLSGNKGDVIYTIVKHLDYPSEF